jgi:hypothetical protein
MALPVRPVAGQLTPASCPHVFECWTLWAQREVLTAGIFARGGVYSGPAAEDSCGQEYYGAYELEDGLEADPQESERDGHQPDERPQHECQERQWPAEDEKNEPEQEPEHGATLARTPATGKGDHRARATTHRTRAGRCTFAELPLAVGVMATAARGGPYKVGDLVFRDHRSAERHVELLGYDTARP